MEKIVMEWCLSNANEENKAIHVQNMEKDVYDNMYKGKLTCIHGCEARIKFTERKNGIRFYSTWNNDGNKHKEDCEFHVNYKGKVGRKRLIAEEEKRRITDEQIENAIDRKIRNLKMKNTKNNGGRKNQSTNKVENTGIGVGKISSGNGDDTELDAKREYVTSIESSFINSTYEKKENVFMA